MLPAHTVHGHSPPLIHRGIRPGQILLTREFVAKVADFGEQPKFASNDLGNPPTNAKDLSVEDALYAAPEASEAHGLQHPWTPPRPACVTLRGAPFFLPLTGDSRSLLQRGRRRVFPLPDNF